MQNIDIKGIKNEGVKAESTWDYVDYLEKFEELWNSTVKIQDLSRYGWNANPWVYVIEFEVMKEGFIKQNRKDDKNE